MNSNDKVTKYSVFHWKIYTDIIINASKEKVWEALTNFKEMPTWSNTLQSIEGDYSKEVKARVNFIFNGSLKKLNPMLTGFEGGTQFGWINPLIPFAKDNHSFRVESLPGGKTKFIQKDEVNGFTAFFIGRFMMNVMIKDYPVFNQRLKKFVESKL